MVQYYGPSIYLSRILPTYLQLSLHKIHVCISFPYIIIYIHPMITIRCAWLHCIIIIYAVHVDVSGFFSPSSLTPTIALERVTRITRVARVHRIEAGTTGHLRTPRHSSERWLGTAHVSSHSGLKSQPLTGSLLGNFRYPKLSTLGHT